MRSTYFPTVLASPRMAAASPQLPAKSPDAASAPNPPVLSDGPRSSAVVACVARPRTPSNMPGKRPDAGASSASRLLSPLRPDTATTTDSPPDISWPYTSWHHLDPSTPSSNLSRHRHNFVVLRYGESQFSAYLLHIRSQPLF